MKNAFLPLLLIGRLLAACEAPETHAKENAVVPESADTLVFTGDFAGPLGLQLWSVREPMGDDVTGTLAHVRAMGFREVELAGTYGLSPATFRQMLGDAGLTPTAMHTGYERLRDSLATVLDEAEALGVQYVGTAWIPHPEGEPFSAAMAYEAAAHFSAWGVAARERGLQFFYHTHGYEFQPNHGVLPFEVMVQETHPDDVQFEMDVFWTALPGVDPAALLRQYPDRWRLMHIKDLQQGYPLGDHSGHAPDSADVPVGTGQIDYRAVLQAAQEIGLDRYYIEDESTDPLGNIPKSIRFLETVRFGGAED